ncbi:hypothetical protein A5906_26235 [Bradyrhizobium sacchari]|nr:hypothetical protein A5906_26235 [Bradyrhizobium sacchari]
MGGLVRLVSITRRHAVHQIAHDAVEFVGADLGKAFIDGLRPEAGRRVALVMPVLLERLASAMAPSRFKVSTGPASPDASSAGDTPESRHAYGAMGFFMQILHGGWYNFRFR